MHGYLPPLVLFTASQVQDDDVVNAPLFREDILHSEVIVGEATVLTARLRDDATIRERALVSR